MIVGTAGHIDHGKTSLVKALTGVDTDRLKEEKERGITLELGYAYSLLPNGEVLGFVDVPGHERLVHTMLAGATGIDYALLVVAADDGPMPQTREHLEILDLLGLTRGAVALTKCDRVDPARLAEAEFGVHALLRGTGLEASPVFPVSSLSGEGIKELRAHLEQAAASLPPRSSAGHFRLAVDRCFSLKGVGIVVTGTAHSGKVRVGDRLLLSPAGIETRVRGLHVQNRPAQEGRAGQRCAINLAASGLDTGMVARGDWVLDQAAHYPVSRLVGRLRLLSREARALKHWTPVHVHLAAADITGRVAILEGDALQPGQETRVELVLDKPVCALRGDRFVIRDQSAQRTLGGGRVLDIFPPVRGKRAPTYLARLAALEETRIEYALNRLLEIQPVNLDEFALLCNLCREEADTLFGAASLVAVDTSAGRLGIQLNRWERLRQDLLAALAGYHRDHPDEAGLGSEALRRVTAPVLPRPAWVALVAELLTENQLARSAFLLRLPGHRAVLSPNERVQWENLFPLLLETPFQPPRVRDIARHLAQDEAGIRGLLRKSEKLGETYQVAHDHFFAPQAVEHLAAIVPELEREHGEVRASVFRDRIDTGRKLAIQILEFFDRVGYTRRAGEGHRLRRDSLTSFEMQRK